MNGALAAGAAAAAEAGERGVRAGSEEGSDVEDITGSVSRQAAGQASAAGAAGDKPSELLKMLRPPQAPRPMFLAAPGVANAQSAYFSFSQFLQARTGLQHCFACTGLVRSMRLGDQLVPGSSCC